MREIRLRNTAQRRGYRLERCRRRDPHAVGYGRYRLVSSIAGAQSTMAYDLSLDDVEDALDPASTTTPADPEKVPA